MIKVPPAYGVVAVARGGIHDLPLDLHTEVPRGQADVALGEIEEILRQSPHE
jgi:hypothetical protein